MERFSFHSTLVNHRIDDSKNRCLLRFRNDPTTFELNSLFRYSHLRHTPISNYAPFILVLRFVMDEVYLWTWNTCGFCTIKMWFIFLALNCVFSIVEKWYLPAYWLADYLRTRFCFKDAVWMENIPRLRLHRSSLRQINFKVQ